MADELIPVIGIGASAGGLEAIEDLLQNVDELPQDAALIVVQHLSPDFKSHMEELLARRTRLPIRRARSGMRVEPGTIYLNQPRADVTLRDGELQVEPCDEQQVPSHPIDALFCSLAEGYGERAIGVVLSGTGSDGSRGVRAIADAGGLVLAQSRKSARFDGMPLSALATGAVDLELEPARMLPSIHEFLRTGRVPTLDRSPSSPLVQEDLEAILVALESSSGIDFSRYKQTTVHRRLKRRMDAQGVDHPARYLERLDSDPEELDALFHDLLIGVTSFFRDREVFEFLETQVIPELVERAAATGSIRIWIAGCATGEEAYSFAMLIEDALRDADSDAALKVFATDIHTGSLAHAERGEYPAEAFDDFDPQRRDRYFEPTQPGRFRVRPELRRRIVFSAHNAIQNAPFTQVDLVSCRNLLIYLQPMAQQKLLSLMHFGLNAGGFLVLGSSETPGRLAAAFEPVAARLRIYRQSENSHLPFDPDLRFVRAPARNSTSERTPVAIAPRANPQDRMVRVYERLLDAVLAPSLLLDADGVVLHAFGGAEELLSMPRGRQTGRIQELLPEELRIPLEGLLHEAVREGGPIQSTDLSTMVRGQQRAHRVEVTPLGDPGARDSHVLIRFLDPSSDDGQGAPPQLGIDQLTSSRIRNLEEDLQTSRTDLQTTIEELETSNEELQSANEEMHSTNEELQSTNEELRSVNEELHNVNAAHQAKIDELTRAHDDMDNLLAVTRVGVLFLDADQRIRRYTPEMARLFELLPQDVGRPFSSFAHGLVADDLGTDVTRVLDTGHAEERRVQDRHGRPYLLRIAPYRSAESVRGAALCMIDVAALESAQRAASQFRDMSEQAIDMHLLVDADGWIEYANPSVSEQLGIPRDSLTSRNLADLTPELGPDRIRSVARSESGHRPAGIDLTFRTATATLLPVSVAISPVEFADRTLYFVAARDTTSQRAAEQELRLYRSAMDATMNGMTIADARLPDFPLIYVNRGFEHMTGYRAAEVLGRNCRFLQGPQTAEDATRRLRDALNHGRDERVTLRNHRKSGEPFWNDVTIDPVRDADGKVTHFVGVQNDITEEVDHARHAERREARLRALLDATVEGIFGTDPQGRVEFCNHAALELLGHDDGEVLLGQPISRLIGSTRLDPGGTTLEDAIRNDRAGRFDGVDMERADGSRFSATVNLRLIARKTGNAGAVITIVDNTERLRNEQRLRNARRDADAANQAKSVFLTNMSHELRTPLTAIMAFLDLLDMNRNGDGRSGHIDGIRRNARSLLDIVNDVLDLSKIEADQVDIHPQRFPLVDVLEDVRSASLPRAREGNLTLKMEFRRPVPAFPKTDPMRLRQILLNLVGNALKFTEEGGVTIRLDFDPESSELIVDVIDTGIGIREDMLQELFRPFQQADPSIERRFGGTGLGLSIVGQLTDRLHGRVSCSSAPGRGSSFTVRVPIGDPLADDEMLRSLEDVGAGAGTEPVDGIGAVPGKVLLVDDKRDVREASALLLGHLGVDVTTVPGGRQALETVTEAEEPFSAILLDLQMPEFSGFETMRSLRESGYAGPVIAFTAQAMKGERDRALAAGFSDYVAKPVSPEQLHRILVRNTREDRRLTVLCIDDSADVRTAMQEIVQSVGHEAYAAGTAAAARAEFRKRQPDLCFVDLVLPDLDGRSLVRRIKEDSPECRTWFVAVSGLEPTARDREERLFDRFLSKPVSAEQIESTMRELGRRRGP